MLTIHSEKHRLRDARTELHGGELVAPFECPARVDIILARIREVGLGEIVEPDRFELDPILAVHDARYVGFLRDAWDEWVAAGYRGEAFPTTWPARRMQTRVPDFIDGRLGYYAMACETSITAGTWEAARASAEVALTGAAHITGGLSAAFALCRPPGHHAGIDLYGGYCFLNNAAIAAQALRDRGAARIALIDIDFHHGNGTQDIFYHRDDVLFLSLHGDPRDAFPHFLGYADETGIGAGEGFNVNYPLPRDTGFDVWRQALATALERIRAFGAEALVVSLGVDIFAGDPISFFRLASDDFRTVGADLAGLELPTLFVMEGGYAVAEIGMNAVNVLQGFLDP